MENYLRSKLTEVIQVDSSVFDFIQQFALDGLWFWDAKSTSSCWINPKLASMLGYNTSEEIEILQKNWSDIFQEKDLTLLAATSQTNSSHKNITVRYFHKDGSTICMDCSILLIYDSEQKLDTVLGANILHKAIQNTPNSLEKFYTSIGESTINSDFLYVIKTNIYGNYTYINDYFYKVFGFTEDEILGTNALLSIIEEDHAACQETVAKCFMNPLKPYKVILRKKNKQQEIVTNQWEFTGLPDKNGSTFEILCVGYNVSEKVKTENDLSILVSNMTDLLISVDYHGIVTFVSGNVTELYLYELDEIVGKPYIDFVHDEDIETAVEAIRKTIATGIPFTNLEIRIKKKEGDFYWTNINSSVNPINKETILVINDITAKMTSLHELKQAKELLQEISEVSNVGGWEYFPEINHFFWSDISRKIYDLPLEFVPSIENIQKFLKPKSKKTFQNAIKKAIQKNISSDLELEIITANQQEIWLRSIIKADFTNDICTRVYGTFQDINQLKKAEIAREKSTKLLKHLTKQVPGILYQFQLTDDGRYFFSYLSRQLVNTPEMDLLSSEEKTKALLKFIHPDDYQMVINSIFKSSKSLTLKDIEFRVTLPSKKERWLKAISTPERLKDSVIWHGYMGDITDRKHVEQELRRTKDFLQETTQVARIGGWEADIDAQTAYWSKITREIYEVDEKYPTIDINDGINYYKEGQSRETLTKAFTECIQYGIPFDIEAQLVTAKNREIWVRVIGKADFSISNRKRVYGTLQDITDTKLAEFQLTRTKDLLEETNRVARIGGWSVDIPSYNVYWSNMIKEIVQVPLDIEPSIAIGLSLYKEGYSRNLITESFKNCIEFGTPFDVELQVVNTKNEDIWVKIIGKAEIEEGKIKRVYGIFQDINQAKIAEENAKNLHQLEILLTKEKQLNLLKSRFISLTSHEFRTPLAGILGSAELLDLYAKKIENERVKNKMQEHISHITSQVDRLTGIVADVLTLEKTAEGKIVVKLKAVPIKAFLQKVTNELYINLRDNRQLKLVLPEDEKEVFTDESLLVHILNNLISNAFKYSRGNKLSPEIQLFYFEDHFTIIVKDYGLGIPMKDQEHLFETFFRADNVVSTEGTGLGLSIAKEFTEKLGGQISFESKEGKGSSFTLKLPY